MRSRPPAFARYRAASARAIGYGDDVAYTPTEREGDFSHPAPVFGGPKVTGWQLISTSARCTLTRVMTPSAVHTRPPAPRPVLLSHRARLCPMLLSPRSHRRVPRDETRMTHAHAEFSALVCRFRVRLGFVMAGED